MTDKNMQNGLSMVELLVALALSSILILGVTQIYIDNKRSYSFQVSQGHNQENSRYAEYLISGWLNKAGYRRTPEQLVEDAFPALSASADCEAFARGAVVAAFKGSTGEKGLCFRYQPVNQTEQDCQGNTVKAVSGTRLNIPFMQSAKDEVVVSVLKFVPDNELHRGSLQCKNLTATTPAFVELIDGIADVHLEYALGEGDLFEKRIKETSPWVVTPPTALSGGLVRAVRYSVLLASAANRRDGDTAILDSWIDDVASTADKTRIENNDRRRIYQQVSSVISLRNMMP
ncbi:MAG: prepilin-type N-terminal cleavage/methylation domain-containing protein [Gammaproteobacteria bacterium]|nr:prepilin-type N-terminal cleavage/methylation domain-containing protein [Gammaproteobacteria bacterium]